MKYLLFIQNNSDGRYILTDDIGKIQVFTVPDRIGIDYLKWRPLLKLFDQIYFDPDNKNRTDCASFNCCGPRWNDNWISLFDTREDLDYYLNEHHNDSYRVEWEYHPKNADDGKDFGCPLLFRNELRAVINSYCSPWIRTQYNKDQDPDPDVKDNFFSDEKELIETLLHLQNRAARYNDDEPVDDFDQNMYCDEERSLQSKEYDYNYTLYCLPHFFNGYEEEVEENIDEIYASDHE